MSLPTRLDRLIAFLDSYFGQVELVRPEDVDSINVVDAETVVDNVVLDPNEPAELAEDELKKKVEEVKAEKEQEQQQQLEQEDPETSKQSAQAARVPIIRVKLDEHVADVRVENLVRFMLRIASLGPSPFFLHPP